jgi:hypothetical protein
MSGLGQWWSLPRRRRVDRFTLINGHQVPDQCKHKVRVVALT